MLTAKGMQPTLGPGWLMALVVLLPWLWRLPAPLSLLGFLSVIPLAIAQSDMNRLWAASDPDAQTRRRLSALEGGLLAVGGIFVGLVVLGTFLPE